METRERLDTLTPDWNPDPIAARVRLNEQMTQPRRSRATPWLVAASAVLALAIALPQTRALARELWQRVTVHRVDVVRFNLSNLALDTNISLNGPIVAAGQDLGKAQELAGFRPRLPQVEERATLSVTGRIQATQTVHVQALRDALRKAGVAGVHVPEEWEGAQLRAAIGPIVTADYPGDVQVLQIQPIELLLPSGFPLEHFAEVVFQSLGLSKPEAAAFARKFAANPALLLDIPDGEAATLRELELPAGPALLIEDLNDRNTPERFTVILNTPDRIYTVSAATQQQALHLANALR